MAEYDNHPDFDLVPRKRNGKETVAAVTVVGFCYAVILCLAFVSSTTQHSTVCSDQEPNCKQRQEKEGIFSRQGDRFKVSVVALVVLSAALGTLADRLCLVWEEKDHILTRYNGDRWKMLKSCFSGPRWSIIVLAIAISILFTSGSSAEGIATLLAGVIVVLLAVRLFNSTTQSPVDVSCILEEKEKSVANGLAWSFYFGYLEIILPGLQHRIRDRQWGYELASNKLFVLLPLDCTIRNNLNDVDHQITQQRDGDLEYLIERGGLDRKYTNKLYCIDLHGRQHRVLVEYATTLDTLRKMSFSAEITSIDEESRLEQAKMFCQTLRGILENPPNAECQKKCELIIYDAKLLEERDGGLASLLVEHIERVEQIERQRNEQELDQGDPQQGINRQQGNWGNGEQRNIQEHQNLEHAQANRGQDIIANRDQEVVQRNEQPDDVLERYGAQEIGRENHERQPVENG